MRKKLMLTVMVCAIALKSLATDPGWSVTPNSFNFDMTITAVLEDNCNALENPSNRLGAFVGNELRGTALSSTVLGGKYLSLISIYSNVASGEEVTFKIYNVETDTILEAKNTVLFQDDAVYGTFSVPLLVTTNSPPTGITISNTAIEENNVISDTLGWVKVEDEDGDNGDYTFTVNNTSPFTFLDSTIIISSVLDYEQKTIYELFVHASDGKGCSFTDTFSITVNNGNDNPSNVFLSNAFIDENVVIGTEIGEFSSVDVDENQTFTYSFVSGIGDSNNVAFTIQGNKLLSNSALNYEVQKQYSIRVSTVDNLGGALEKQFLVSLNNLNDKPTDITLDNASIEENSDIATTVGVLSAADEDEGEFLAFSFKDIPGNNNDRFFIVGNDLKASQSFDFETQSEYYIYINVVDGQGEEFFKVYNIKITDGNDAPTDIQVSNLSVSEDQSIGSFIGRITTTDIDVNQTHLHQLANGVGDVDNSSFTLRNDSLFTNTIFDEGIKSTYEINIQSNDQNGGLFNKAFEIFVKDVNSAPTDIQLDNGIVQEDVTRYSVVGNLTTIDSDLGDGHRYALVAGVGDTDNSSFQIFGSELKTNTTFDFETKSSYQIRLKVQDNFGGTYSKNFEIIISNGNDEPTDITLGNTILVENGLTNTLVGKFITTDKDTDDTHTYSFVETSGSSNDFFFILGDELKTNTVFDYEANATHFVAIKSTDASGGEVTRQFVITIKDTNDAPTAIQITGTKIGENQPVMSFIGVLSSVDVDPSDVHSYNLASGAGDDDNASFVIIPCFLTQSLPLMVRHPILS